MLRICNNYCKDDIKMIWVIMYILMDSQIPYGYIYKIEFPNGKHYIGLTTTSLKIRQSQHKKCAKGNDTQYLYNALRKYKIVDTFELIEIDTADSKEELCEKEMGYILMYNSFDREYGYNMTLGGEGVNGWVPSQEQRERAREKTIQYFEKLGAREKHSEALKTYFEEHPETREKMRESTIKYFRETLGAREKQSEALKKYHADNPDARLKAIERTKKHYEENPEARLKMSEQMKKYYEDHPEARQQHSETMKMLLDNPEARLKMSEISKKHHKEHPESAKKRLDTMGKNKPFDVFKKDGTFIKTFTYQIDAIEYLKKEQNITSTIYISRVLKGKLKSTAGFIFKYKDEIPSTSES